ncbi:MAG: S41 family peptidase, partial [Bacteroidota bacterium]
FNLYQFSNGIYVQGVQKNYPKALGAKVLEVNGVPIAEALQKVYPVVSAENSQFFKAHGINFLTIPEVLHAQGITDELELSVSFTLEKDGKTFETLFTALPENERIPNHYGYVFENENWLEARQTNVTPLYLKYLEKMYFFEYLPEAKTVYVRLSQIEDDPSEKMASFYGRLFEYIENNSVEKLVLDVRLNGGGNNFKNRAFITSILENKNINQVGKFFVILGRRTFSACQNLVNELDNYTNVIFVGEPTGENVNFYGDIRITNMPNSKIALYLSYAWWQDKPAWQNAEWLAPSLPVDMSFEEYSTNQDPVLDAALTFADDSFIPNPMRYITDGFVNGNIEELAREVPMMIQDPKYGFFDFETEISKAGLLLAKSGTREGIQVGVGVLSFVTELFPSSPKAWKNLAMGHLNLGEEQKAKAFLNKTIALDSDGAVGKSAKDMLRELDD